MIRVNRGGLLLKIDTFISQFPEGCIKYERLSGNRILTRFIADKKIIAEFITY